MTMSFFIFLLGIVLTGLSATALWGATASWFATGIIFLVFGFYHSEVKER